MRIFENQSLLLSSVRRCVQSYEMIDDGDVIAVGASGGKDSTALLCALALMRRFYPKRYEVVAISVDLGFEGGIDLAPLTSLCKELDVPHHIVKTDISEIVFSERNEDNPCSLCSKMRRGALHADAERLGCTKVALGHNRDDVSATLLLNILYAGKISVFWPKNTPDERSMTLIRPLIYTSEKNIKEFCRKNALPIIKNPCPEDKNTHRETVNELIRSIEKESPGVSHRIFRAIEKSGIDGFIDK